MGSEPVMLDVLGTRLTAKDEAPLVGGVIRTMQELFGHSDVSTTMTCTHVMNRGGKGVVSPLDR